MNTAAEIRPFERLPEHQKRQIRTARQRFERAFHDFRERYPSAEPTCLRIEVTYQALLESLGMSHER